MSTRHLKNARSKGRKAYLDGIQLADNPMRSTDSRYEWADVWENEKRIMDLRSAALKDRIKLNRARS